MYTGTRLVTSMAAALNWSGKLFSQRWANGINLWPNAVLALNHPLDEHTVCSEFSWILINIAKKCF